MKKNPDAKPKRASDALLKRWAARVIEYRACGLSWEECSDLIRSKEMTPYFDRPDTVIRIAEWRLENVHEDKMTMPPEQWRSPEELRREALDADYRSFKAEHKEKLDHWKSCRDEWFQGPERKAAKPGKEFDRAFAVFSERYAKEHGTVPRFLRFDELDPSRRKANYDWYGHALAQEAATD